MTSLRIVDTTVIDNDERPNFDLFWFCWPRERRVCKKEARDAWNRIPEKDWPRVIESGLLWRREWERRGEWQYVPHPHRWLRNERYEDELPHVQMAASHAPARPPDAGSRTTMPEHVRALIAKLRAK